MNKIFSGYTTQTGIKLYYSIIEENGKENGFDIYEGESEHPTLHQPEPWIPDKSKSYEENAIQMCKELSEILSDSSELPFKMTSKMYDELTSANEMMRADLDYLLLLSE